MHLARMIPQNSIIEIYDITGRKVKTYRLSKNQNQRSLEASEIGIGMFFIQVASDGNLRVTKKVAITK